MIRLEHLTLSYNNHNVFLNTDFKTYGLINCILGKSGSGKTTLLNALSGNIDIECEKFIINDIDMCSLAEEDRNFFFRNNIAYVTQNDNFIDDLSCLDNLRLSYEICGKSMDMHQLNSFLELVGLSISKEKYPTSLSGGEKRKLALVQALIKDTCIILCDEITASLDEESKKDIIGIIEKIANTYKKQFIIATHDLSLIDKSDCVYKIENNKINLIKKDENYHNERLITKFGKKYVSKDILRKYVFSKYDRNFKMLFIYSLIVSIAVALSAYLVYFTYSHIELQSNILASLTPTELTIVNQTLPKYNPNQTYSYHVNNKPFTNAEQSFIFEIATDEKIYPFYFGTSLKDISDVGKEGKIEVNLDEKTYTIDYSKDVYTMNYIPYYKEQNFETNHKVINSDNGEVGAYVNRSYLNNVLGMNNINFDKKTNIKIKTEICVPVGYIKAKTVIGYPNGETETTEIYNPVYESVSIDIPIIGVIDDYYTEEMYGDNVYLPFEYMEDLRNQAISKHKFCEDEYMWMPNAYKVYTDSVDKMDALNAQIIQISEEISTGVLYSNYVKRFESNNYIKVTSCCMIAFCLVVGVVLSFVFGIHYYEKQKRDLKHFKSIKLTKYELKQVIRYDIQYQSIIVYVFSLFFSTIIFSFGKMNQAHTLFPLLSVKTLSICAISLFLSILFVFLSRVYEIKKVKYGNDKN